jgi:hypothetical protein
VHVGCGTHLHPFSRRLQVTCCLGFVGCAYDCRRHVLHGICSYRQVAYVLLGRGGGGGSKSEKCPSHPGRMSQCPTTPLFAISRGIMSALATCQLQCTGRHRPYIGFVAAAYA